MKKPSRIYTLCEVNSSSVRRYGKTSKALKPFPNNFSYLSSVGKKVITLDLQETLVLKKTGNDDGKFFRVSKIVQPAVPCFF